MNNHFRMAADNPVGNEDWVTRRWVCHPASTGAKQLTVLDATLGPGQAHSFHSHPNQDEVVVVIAGKIEQWIENEKRLLGFGDAAFIPGDARLVAIFGPSIGDGFETIDNSGEAKWRELRKSEKRPPSN